MRDFPQDLRLEALYCRFVSTHLSQNSLSHWLVAPITSTTEAPPTPRHADAAKPYSRFVLSKILPRKCFVRTLAFQSGTETQEDGDWSLFIDRVRIRLILANTYCMSSKEGISVNAEDREPVKGASITNLRNCHLYV